MVFNFTSKSPLLFGAGAIKQIGNKAREFGWSKVILIYDKGVKSVGIVDKVIASLDASGISYVEYDGVLPDPPDTVVEAAASLARGASVEGVVAIGGGSSLDVGKCVSILLSNPSPINQYWGIRTDLNPVPGAILVPTTAGTGSEMSDAAIISDTTNGVKVGVVGPSSKAKLALIDPELTYGLPAALTAQTALDAFTHGFEAFTGTGNNPMSDLLAQQTMKLVAENLLVVLKDPGNTDARSKLSFAAMLGGMAFVDSMTHLGHNIGQNIGTLTHIPHGTSCTLGVLAIIEFLSDAVPARIRWVGELFGLSSGAELSDEELGREVYTRFKAFCENAGVPTSLSAAGVPEDVLEKASQLIEADPVLNIASPKKLDASEALKLMKKIY